MLDKESESALKLIGSLSDVNGGNSARVEESVRCDCLRHLREHGFVSLSFYDEEMAFSGLPEDHYVLTLAGRNYFSGKRRTWLWKNSNALIGAASGIAGTIAGFVISSIL